MTPLLQAAEALVAALIDDPFYWAISEDFGTDLAARKVALKSYFCYSLEEAKRRWPPMDFSQVRRENYRRIVSYMAPLAGQIVPSDAWYLSIIGIVPSAQGQGLGAALLTGTLVEASNARVSCYLETFSTRNLKFYERLGFCRAACHFEPTTNKEYVVMRRDA